MKGFEIIVKDELFKHFKGLALGADNIVKDPTNNGYWVNTNKQPQHPIFKFVDLEVIRLKSKINKMFSKLLHKFTRQKVTEVSSKGPPQL